jgi:hypothetical protein
LITYPVKKIKSTKQVVLSPFRRPAVVLKISGIAYKHYQMEQLKEGIDKRKKLIATIFKERKGNKKNLALLKKKNQALSTTSYILGVGDVVVHYTKEELYAIYRNIID